MRDTLLHTATKDFKQISIFDAWIGLQHRMTQQFFPPEACLPDHAIIDIQISPVKTDDLRAFEHMIENILIVKFALSEALFHLDMLQSNQSNDPKSNDCK